LSNPKDEEESRRKAIVVAEMIERLAKQSAVGREKRKERKKSLEAGDEVIGDVFLQQTAGRKNGRPTPG